MRPKLHIRERIAGLADKEQALLAAGERPQPRMKNRLQRTAVRMLAIFLVLMLVFTVVSRMANSVTVASVQVDAIKTGTLTDRAGLTGTIEAAGDISLLFPEGLRIETVYANEGQRVSAGDPLLQFDTAELESQLEGIEIEITIMKLKISVAQIGVSGNDSESILAAQQALDNALEAYDRLVKKHDRELLRIAEEYGDNESVVIAQQALADALEAYDRLVAQLERDSLRSEEDYADLEAALKKAKSNYERVLANTKASLISAAEDAVKQAEENLETVKESADDAIRSAQLAVDSAAESLNTSESTYQSALTAYSQAAIKLNNAKQLVSDLEAAAAQGEDNTEALAAARDALDAAQENFYQAESNLDAQSVYGTSAYDNAVENLAITKQRWEKNIQKAETALSEAKAELEAVRKRTDFSEEAAVISAQAAVDSAESALKSAQRLLDDNEYSYEEQLCSAQSAISSAETALKYAIKNAQVSLEDDEYAREEQLYSAEKAIEAAQRDLESAQRQAILESQNNAVSATEATIARMTYQYELSELEKQRDALEEAMLNDGIVTAPVNGTVLKILEKGDNTSDIDVVTLSRNDEAFVFEGSLDNATSEKLIIGDTGALAYTHEGSTQKLEVEIASISVPDEDGNVTISAELPEGSYHSGASAELTITKKSETYYNCLPLSVLRSDANGDHVLILRQKSTVMGTEWTVARVDVSVTDRDSELMSVESTLSYSDKVVVSANKPISEGDRVRIEG